MFCNAFSVAVFLGVVGIVYQPVFIFKKTLPYFLSHNLISMLYLIIIKIIKLKLHCGIIKKHTTGTILMSLSAIVNSGCSLIVTSWFGGMAMLTLSTSTSIPGT
jgi:hypothetical protein